MYSHSRVVLSFALLCLAPPALAHAQTTASPPPQTTAAASSADRDTVVAESDFVISALPTTLPLDEGKFAFRMTHRFSYAINKGLPGDGSSLTGQFFKNFFGFDSSPSVAIEFRVGIAPGTQLAVQRVNERTIEFLGQHQLVKQGAGDGVSVDLITGVEGAQNFSEDFGFTLGAVVSHRFQDRGAIYLEPIAVFNSNPATPLPASGPEGISSNNTFMLGLGTRVRLGGKSYVVFEATPRLGGYSPGTTQFSVGIEERVGGHVFQLNVSNGFSTTLRQLASARPPDGINNWHIGFNLTRKF